MRVKLATKEATEELEKVYKSRNKKTITQRLT
jgi:hypothetical protein